MRLSMSVSAGDDIYSLRYPLCARICSARNFFFSLGREKERERNDIRNEIGKRGSQRGMRLVKMGRFLVPVVFIGLLLSSAAAGLMAPRRNDDASSINLLPAARCVRPVS